MGKQRTVSRYMYLGLFFFLYSFLVPTEASDVPDGMVRIPAGEFWAGDPGSSKKVDVAEFDLDKYEVTQKEFVQVIVKNPSQFKGENRPVEKVTWYQADIYCKRIGKRLPTEKEWQKAAKGGKNTLYSWGGQMASGKANFCDSNCENHWRASRFDDGFKHTAPIGSFPPNGYGLYDMAGNVSEWVSDWYERKKSLHGGSWDSYGYFVRPSHRISVAPYRRFPYSGFRCAK